MNDAEDDQVGGMFGGRCGKRKEENHGETLDLKKQGEKLTFLKTVADTNGEYVEMEVSMSPAAYGPPPHIHSKQVEWFEVVSGSVILTVNKQEHKLEAGQKLEVKAGQTHTFRNGSDDARLEMKAGLRPALHIEWFLTESAESAIRNGGSWADLPPLEAAYMLHQIRGEYRVAKMPSYLQDVLFGLMAGIAKITGKSKYIRPLNR